MSSLGGFLGSLFGASSIASSSSYNGLSGSMGMANASYEMVTYCIRSEEIACEFVTHEKPYVAVVGAGPVGLWTAIQMRMLLPQDCAVVVFEKRKEYVRNHVVSVEEFFLRESIFRDAALSQLAKDMQGTNRISDLEKRLRTHAESIGVIISYSEITPDVLTSECIPKGPQYHKMIAMFAADGAHSTVRKTLFGDARSTYEESTYALELRYETPFPVSNTDLTNKYKLIKAGAHAVNEHISSKSTGSVVYLRIIISAEEFVQCSSATFAKPWMLADPSTKDRTPSALWRCICMWLNFRAGEFGEERVANSERFSVVSLAPYRSAVFARPNAFYQDPCAKGAPVFLVGDAAFGVPFFRSLNNGLNCGTLAAHVAKNIYVVHEQGRSAVAAECAAYNRMVGTLADAEIQTVRSKRSLLDLAHMWCYASAHVPWEMVRFSQEEREKLEKDLY